MASQRYSVYVVELKRSVWTERWQLRRRNPTYNGMKECLYVGMTSLSPQQRLTKHMTGARSKRGHRISSSIVKNYGLYLRPSLYAHLNPLTKMEAQDIEMRLAKRLQKQGYAVWWN
ncbi:MAG: ribose-5-phosphate isomerase [Bacteroidota bacterium]